MNSKDIQYLEAIGEYCDEIDIELIESFSKSSE